MTHKSDITVTIPAEPRKTGLSDFDAKVLEKYQGAEAVVGVNPYTGCDTVTLGSWYGEITITEHSIIYGPFGTQKEWEIGYNGPSDVSAQVKWAVNETCKMMEQDRDRLVVKLLAMRDAPTA